MIRAIEEIASELIVVKIIHKKSCGLRPDTNVGMDGSGGWGKIIKHKNVFFYKKMQKKYVSGGLIKQ